MTIKIVIVGSHGKMGKELISAIEKNKEFVLMEGVNTQNLSKLPLLAKKADLIIDFSSIDALDALLKTKKPLVIGTTGYTKQDFQKIEQYAKNYPVLYSANFSLGVATMQLLLKEVKKAFSTLSSVDIIDTHHAMKKDAPSGTALLLHKTLGNNIPISHHSIRAGKIIAEHSVLFHSDTETLEVKHTAHNRSVFANGALLAAKFIHKKEKGLYNLLDMLQENAF